MLPRWTYAYGGHCRCKLNGTGLQLLPVVLATPSRTRHMSVWGALLVLTQLR